MAAVVVRVLEPFAGAGGWDLAARSLGVDPIGLELDRDACATRRAAGLRTMECDVAAVDFACGWTGRPLDGLIASPPCTAFAMPGKGAGRLALDVYVDAIERAFEGKPVSREELDAECDDASAHLVLEPCRWALALRPEWVALEQVPPVLPVWEALARGLRTLGYSTWTGLLSAEQFGVPQTRRRAFLAASRVREVVAPVVSHARYVAPRASVVQEEALFAAPAAERIVLPEDRALLPWVSMAQALGWDGGDRVGFPRIADTADATPDGYRARDFREGDEPAFALTEKARSAVRFRATNERENGCARPAHEPAPSLAFGHNAPVWVLERPATTVQGDPRVWPPGHKVNADDVAAGRDGYGDRAGSEAVRVTLPEAAVLQSFPADYPWCGSRSSCFRQVGNAVPWPMAAAVLRVLLEQ